MNKPFLEAFVEQFPIIDAGWRKFEVKVKKSPRVRGTRVYGSVCFDFALITLDESMMRNDEMAAETIIHELTHLILETRGLDDRESAPSPVQNLTNEELTIAISRGLMTLGNLNPGLMGFLFR